MLQISKEFFLYNEGLFTSFVTFGKFILLTRIYHSCYFKTMDSEKKEISNYLRRYRLMLGYTQGQVASKLGIKSTSIISRWEKGSAFPDLRNLLKLSIIYKTLIDQLYFELRQTLTADMCLNDINQQNDIKPP